MRINLKPLKLDGLLCFNACVTTALSALNLPYWYLFSNSFNLRYYENDISNKAYLGEPLDNGRYYVGACISTGENHGGENIYMANAVKYFNLKAQNKPKATAKCLEAMVGEGDIVVFNTNVGWCPWLDEYRKGDVQHIILFNSLLGDGRMECVDSMHSGSYVYMDENDHDNGVKSIDLLTFEPAQAKPIHILRESFMGIKGNDMHSHMDLFIKDIEEMEDFANEFALCDVGFWSCDLLRNTSYYIGGSRLLYSLFLEKITQETGISELEGLAAEVKICGQKWRGLKTLFIRSHIAKDYEGCKVKLLAQLRFLQETEAGIVKRINGLCLKTA